MLFLSMNSVWRGEIIPLTHALRFVKVEKEGLRKKDLGLKTLSLSGVLHREIRLPPVHEELMVETTAAPW